MARILNRVLNALGLVLRPEGGQVTLDQVALDAWLQPVYDVRRQAELAAGNGRELMRGWWLQSLALNIAGVGTNYSGLANPYTFIAAGVTGVQPVAQQDIDVWLMDVSVVDTAVANSITSCALNLSHPPLPGSTGSPNELIYLTTVAVPMNSVAGGADVQGYQPAFKLTVPRYLAPGTGLSGRTVATGAAANAFANFLYYVGPKGTTPPGVA